MTDPGRTPRRETGTESRQASGNRMNFWIMAIALVALAIAGAFLLIPDTEDVVGVPAAPESTPPAGTVPNR